MFVRGWLAWLMALASTSLAWAEPELLPPEVEVQEEPTQAVYLPPSECRPLGRWWLDTSLEFGWTSTRPAPQTVRLLPPDLFGNRVALKLPLNGQHTNSSQIGLAFHGGLWLTDDQIFGIDLGAYFSTSSTRSVNGYTKGTLVYFPNGPDQSAPLFIRFPRTFAGFSSAVPASASTWFATADTNFRAGLLITDSARLDLLVGYRFAYLEDDLYLGKEPLDEHDEFRQNRMTVENTFHGGQVGLEGRYNAKSWYTSSSVKLAYGALTTKTSAAGAFQYLGESVQFGSDTRSAFLPAFNARLGYRLSPGASLFVGYNFLYLTGVSRFGDAFACTSNSSSDFWIQSVSLGFDWHY